MMETSRTPFHVAIFCRPLIAGQVKTRLIPTYGADGAARIYAQLVERALRVVADSGASASLWVAGDRQHASLIDWSQRYGLSVHAQHDGDLGERMAHAIKSLAETHARVLLIGTDCPVLTAADLHTAAALLSDTCHWVFAPAEDGGYALVGSNAPSAAPFANIAWSTSVVMTQTRAALLANGLPWAETRTLWDVDQAADVERANSLGLLAVR